MQELDNSPERVKVLPMKPYSANKSIDKNRCRLNIVDINTSVS